MNIIQATPETYACDTLQPLLSLTAGNLARAGYVARGGYLDAVTPSELAAQLTSGLPFFGIGYAKQFDGKHLLERVTALGLPMGCTVVLDIEGITVDAPTLISELDYATKLLHDGGRLVAGYFGAQQPLTSDEISGLAMTRYVRSCSIVRDRFGKLAAPERGWCMLQEQPPNQLVCGVTIDRDRVLQDYFGGVLTWVAA